MRIYTPHSLTGSKGRSQNWHGDGIPIPALKDLQFDREENLWITDYLLPSDANIRRVFVDSTNSPVTFWVGSNHGASILKLEPIDASGSN